MGIDQLTLRKTVSLSLGVLTLVAVVLLLAQDAAPRHFLMARHQVLAALSLAMIAVAYLSFRVRRRAAAPELAKAILLASAFLFWAANQYWPGLPQAGLFNDIAIGLFVLDVFLVMAARPAQAAEGSLSATAAGRRCRCVCGGCCCASPTL